MHSVPRSAQYASQILVLQSVLDKLMLCVGDEQLTECRNTCYTSCSSVLITWL